jgi:hypothetical protein
MYTYVGASDPTKLEIKVMNKINLNNFSYLLSRIEDKKMKTESLRSTVFLGW